METQAASPSQQPDLVVPERLASDFIEVRSFQVSEFAEDFETRSNFSRMRDSEPLRSQTVPPAQRL